MDKNIFEDLRSSVTEVKVLKGILDGTIKVEATCIDKELQDRVVSGLSDSTFYRYALAKVMSLMSYLVNSVALNNSDVDIMQGVMDELYAIGIKLLFDGIFAGEEPMKRTSVQLSNDEIISVMKNVTDGVVDRYDKIVTMSNIFKELQQLELNFVLVMKVILEFSKGTFDEYGDKFIEACNRTIDVGSHSSLLLANMIMSDVLKVQEKGDFDEQDLLMFDAIAVHMQTISGCFAVIENGDTGISEQTQFYVIESNIIDKIYIPLELIEQNIRDIGKLNA